MIPQKSIFINDLSGGLNDGDTVTPNQWGQLMNMQPWRKKKIRKRKGKVPFNSSAISGVNEFKDVSQFGAGRLVVGDDGHLYKSVRNSFEDVGELFTKTSEPVTSISFLSRRIFTNGKETVKSFDGKSIEEHPDIPIGKFIVPFFGYLLVCAVEGNHYTVYRSDLNSLTAASGAYKEIDIGDKDDGAEFIGVIVRPGDYRATFIRSNGVYTLEYSGNSDFPLIPSGKLSSHGGAATKSIVEINGFVIRLDYDGVYAWGGRTDENITSKLIETVMASVNPRAIEKAAAWHDQVDKSYTLCIPTGISQTNNYMLKYFYERKAWYIWDIPASCGMNFRYRGKNTSYAAGYDGKLYQLHTGENDAGAAIAAWARTGKMKFGTANKKRFRYLCPTFEEAGDYNVTVMLIVDSITESSVVLSLRGDSAEWDGTEDKDKWDAATFSKGAKVTAKINLYGYGEEFEIEYRNENANEPFVLEDHTFVVQGKGLVRKVA